MKLKIDLNDLHWWFWFITLVFLIAAIAGWTEAYRIVIFISAIQVVYFLIREKSILAFPVQIRLVYFGFTLFGLWPAVRLIFFIILLLGTVMVTFWGKCSIALILKPMPWNKGREVRLN